MSVIDDFTKFCESLDKIKMLSRGGDPIYINNEWEICFDTGDSNTSFYIIHPDIHLVIPIDGYGIMGDSMMGYLYDCIANGEVEHAVTMVLKYTHYKINNVEQTFTLPQLTDLIVSCCEYASMLNTRWHRDCTGCVECTNEIITA